MQARLDLDNLLNEPKAKVEVIDKKAFDKLDGNARLNFSIPTSKLYSLICRLLWHGDNNCSGIYPVTLNDNRIELRTAAVSLNNGKTEDLELFCPTNLLETKNNPKIDETFKQLLKNK